MLALGLKDLPSDRIMDDIDRALQKCAEFKVFGTQGNWDTYYVIAFAAIITQVKIHFDKNSGLTNSVLGNG